MINLMQSYIPFKIIISISIIILKSSRLININLIYLGKV